MNKKSILISLTLSLILSCGVQQNANKMVEKQLQIRNDQATINYVQAGNGEYTLLFLHGWCINSTYWEEQIKHFSTSYSVYALDLAGFGKSTAERQDWTIEEFAKDILAFMDALVLENVILVGHSMSGEIMLQTALANSPRIIGVVGVDNFKFLDVEFSEEDMEQMKAFFPVLQKDFKQAAPMYADNLLFHPSTQTELKERIKAEFANTDPTVGYASFMNYMEYSEDVASKLERLAYPLYLINSDAVPTNMDGLKAHCKKGFEVLDVHATGHFPMAEKPAEFTLQLEKALWKIVGE